MLQENLKKVRLKLGYSQQEIADKLKININTYRGYEYNKREMPYEILKFLSNVFCVNINWLLTGNGNMFFNSPANNDFCPKENNSDNPIFFKIGSRLNKLQHENKVSDSEMAKILGIYEYEYKDLKNGIKEPTLKILNCLKQTFKISIDWILDGE